MYEVHVACFLFKLVFYVINVLADNATTAWNLNTYADNTTALLASFTENNIPNGPGVNTNLVAALSELLQNVMSPSGGDRPNVPNVCILITADVPNINTNGFLSEATVAKNTCKLIIVIVGQRVRQFTV